MRLCANIQAATLASSSACPSVCKATSKLARAQSAGAAACGLGAAVAAPSDAKTGAGGLAFGSATGAGASLTADNWETEASVTAGALTATGGGGQVMEAVTAEAAAGALTAALAGAS